MIVLRSAIPAALVCAQFAVAECGTHAGDKQLVVSTVAVAIMVVHVVGAFLMLLLWLFAPRLPIPVESSGFLFFLLLWRFFHRNHDSCSAVTFLESHQVTCLHGAYIESYLGYQFVRQKQSRIQFYGTLQWLLSTTIAAPPPPLLHRHCCAATSTATPITAPPLPLPSLNRLSRCCAA
jgi:hypothetical protein